MGKHLKRHISKENIQITDKCMKRPFLFFGRLLIINSIYLIQTYSNHLFLLVWMLADCIFQGNGPFDLGYKICGHRVFQIVFFIILLVSIGSTNGLKFNLLVMTVQWLLDRNQIEGRKQN